MTHRLVEGRLLNVNLLVHNKKRPEISKPKKWRTHTQTHLTRRNGPAGVIVPYAIHDARDPAAGVTAPDEVEAGDLGVELVLAGQDGRGHQGLGVGHALVGGRVGEAGVDGFLDAEDEEDEEEGGEELEEGGPLVPPREQQVLPEQGLVLLEQQRRPGPQRHGRRDSSSALSIDVRSRFRESILVVRSKLKRRVFIAGGGEGTTENGAFLRRIEGKVTALIKMGSGVAGIYGLCHGAG